MIDPKKPIRFKGDVNRPCTLVGVRSNGTILIDSVYGNGDLWGQPEAFTPEGAAITIGCSLQIENAPTLESGFYPLDKHGSPYGRGLISLHMAKGDYPGPTHFIEIVRTNGVPDRAVIHAR